MIYTKMKKVNIGIIGLGYWGPNLLRNFHKVPGTTVVAACDLLEKNLKSIRKDFPSIQTTTDSNDLINNNVIDLIAIATPLTTHYSLAKMALMAGKHILVEKPFTKTTKEGKELIQIAAKNKRILMVGHTFIYSGAVQKIKQLLTKGSLGKIHYYDSQRINLGLIQNDTNVIVDLAPHDLAILSFLFPKSPLSVQAFGSSHVNSQQEELAHIFIRYPDNFIAHIHVSWLSPVKIRSILIGGNKKMIVYNDIEPSEKIRIYDKRITLKASLVTPFSPAYRSGDILIPRLKQTEALFEEVSHCIDCIRRKKKPLTDGNEGLKVVMLLEAIQKALKEKREVFLNEKTK